MTKALWALGLEELNDDVVPEVLPVPEHDPELEHPSETVEARLVETDGLDRELAELAQDGERLHSDTRRLESVEDIVTDSVSEERAGMSEHAARVAEVAVESYCERWNIQRPAIGVESFQQGNSREATLVALEGIGSAIGGAYETLVTYITTVSNKMKDFWVSYVNAGKAIITRAAKLSAKLEAGLGEKKEERITSDWNLRLHLAGKPDPEAVIKMAADMVHGVEGAAKIVKDAGEAFKIGGGQAFKPHKGWFGLNMGNPVSNGMGGYKSIGAMIPHGASEVKLHALPGNNFLVNYTHEEQSVVKFLGANHPGGEAKDVATPTEAQLKAAIAAIHTYGEVLSEKLINFRGTDAKLAEVAAEVKKAKEALKVAKGSKDKEQIEAGKKGIAAARQLVANTQEIIRAATIAPRLGAEGLIKYVGSGFAAYGKKAKEAAAAAE